MSEAEDISVQDVKVMIGMPAYKAVNHRTVKSIVETTYLCGRHGLHLDFAMEVSGVVTVARDAVFDDFIKSKAQKLFWIDSDIVWSIHDFMKMVALSTKVDVLCASYPARGVDRNTYYLDFAGTPRIGNYGLIEILGTGLGFTIMDRKVCEDIAATKETIKDVNDGRSLASVFRIDTVDGKRRTEDMAFFSDIHDLGYKIWCDPDIELGHVGDREWRGRLMETFAPAKEKAYG